MTPLRLTRSNQEIGSFLGALGCLRETRLTAVLGFLISRFPDDFGPLLGFSPFPGGEISLEETDTGDRYDVLVKRSGAVLIIEGKIGPTQSVADQISEENLVPVGEGISFVSKVISVQVIHRSDVVDYLKAQQHPKVQEAAKLVKTNHSEPDVLIMMLGAPRLMFISPVTKAKLSKVLPLGNAGMMGSRSCSFDDLLAASQ